MSRRRACVCALYLDVMQHRCYCKKSNKTFPVLSGKPYYWHSWRGLVRRRRRRASKMGVRWGIVVLIVNSSQRTLRLYPLFRLQNLWPNIRAWEKSFRSKWRQEHRLAKACLQSRNDWRTSGNSFEMRLEEKAFNMNNRKTPNCESWFWLSVHVQWASVCWLVFLCLCLCILLYWWSSSVESLPEYPCSAEPGRCPMMHSRRACI